MKNKYYFENTDPNRPPRSKQMGHVKDLLRDMGIQDEAGLRQLINGRTSIQFGEATFQVLNARDLELDDENRLYEREFKLREVIVDVNEVHVRNSARVDLRDCIFMGKLYVGNNLGKSVEVRLDTVVICRCLSLHGSGDAMDVGMTDVRCPEVLIKSMHGQELSLSGCGTASLALANLSFSKLSVGGSNFEALEVADCQFENVWFPPKQVSFASFRRPSVMRHWMRREPTFNVFEFSKTAISEENLDSLSRSEALKRRAQTLDFLQTRSEDRYSRKDVAELKYLRALAECRGPFSRLWVVSTGALVKPLRVAVVAGLTIALFAAIYYWAPLRFNGVGAMNSAWNALYFSGISFTTIGYGDITPLGAAKIFAVLEGLLGIVMSSALVVSIVRRHIE